jgi:uncharacterized protein YndB with AHSA1/START domain
MTTISPAPVRKSVALKAAPERAFAVFTANMGRWWLRTHTINASPMKDVVIEPRVGGRWYELGEDGSQCEWGKVLAWEPPRRVLLAWQINGEWKYDAALVTEVEVTFISDSGGTRVELEHRHLERIGAAAEAVRQAIDSPGGWSGLLTAFAESLQ